MLRSRLAHVLFREEWATHDFGEPSPCSYPGYRTGGRPSTGGVQIIRHGMSPHDFGYIPS